jgi:chromosome partitioning protein
MDKDGNPNEHLRGQYAQGKIRRVVLESRRSQGNSTHYLLGKLVQDENQTLAKFFRECLSLNPFASGPSCSLNEIAQPTPFENLSIICPHVEMESLRNRLWSHTTKIYKLRDALSDQSQFDEVYIDTPPVLNFYGLFAPIASRKCLTPFDYDAFSKEALYTILGVIGKIRMDHNPKLEVEGIVVNQFQHRANLPRRLVENLVDEGQRVLNTNIPRGSGSANRTARQNH